MRTLLPLGGRIVASPGALKLLLEAGGHPFDYLARHAAGDWRELCAFDRRQNEIALRDGYRVLSSYDVLAGKVWIIHRGRPLCHHHPTAGGVQMSCELCGGGDMWIKTRLTPEGSRLLVCDECYGEHATVLVIVPGGRTNPRSGLLAAAGQRQYLRDHHGGLPGRGGHGRAQGAPSPGPSTTPTTRERSESICW
jgi:hypothetical protein